MDLKNVTVPDALTMVASPCGISVRANGIPDSEASRVTPAVQFNQTKPSDVFRLVVTAAGWRYTVVDDKAVVLTKTKGRLSFATRDLDHI